MVINNNALGYFNCKMDISLVFDGSWLLWSWLKPFINLFIFNVFFWAGTVVNPISMNNTTCTLSRCTETCWHRVAAEPKTETNLFPSRSEKQRASKSLCCLSSLLGRSHHDVGTPSEYNVLKTHKTLFDKKILPCLRAASNELHMMQEAAWLKYFY